MTLYYESHITIEPVFDERLEEATKLAKVNGFKIANLLMQKRSEDSPERSKHDTFMTSHSKDRWLDIRQRTIDQVLLLKANNFVVWRYKIEEVIVDSKINDTFKIL